VKLTNEYNLSFHVCRTPDDFKSAEDGYQAVLEGLGRNIISKIGDMELGKDVQIFIRNNENKVVGGAKGSVFGGWLYVSLTWVEESLRNQGYGTKMLKMMEDEAVKLGCKHAHVDTYSFEAKPFYEKNGYTLFASLENYPEGHSKHFLKKKTPLTESVHR
jgi:GNAT superfamily N-acetyltransferase